MGGERQWGCINHLIILYNCRTNFQPNWVFFAIRSCWVLEVCNSFFSSLMQTVGIMVSECFISYNQFVILWNELWSGFKNNKNGFGNPTQEFWLGNDRIYRLTDQHHELLVELEEHDKSVTHARYSYFSIGFEENGYELHLGSYRGSAGDVLTYHKNVKFSTKDEKNDEGCSQEYRSGWWYKGCNMSNSGVKKSKNFPGVDEFIT